MELTEEMKQEILSIFEYLHTHPEISWKEINTTQYIANKLKALGCRVQTFDDCTGVIAEIGSGSPIIGLRADMDALWQEVDGTFKANHSCGHDAHMTMVLGTLMMLKQQDTLPQGTIRFIFQPAEEKGMGALKIIEKGVIDDLEFLYGVHVRPIQETANGHATPAILHGSTQSITGTIIGEDAHAARPHLGTNSIEIAATLVHELAHIHVDPMVPHSVKMTKLHAGGESSNIIPGKAEFSLDLRAQTNEVMESLIAHVQGAAQSVAQFYNVNIDMNIPENLAAATENLEAETLLAAAIEDTIGKENLDPPLVTTGGEDFHFYSLKRPKLKATMLGLGCGLEPGLHHPHMTFDRKALFSGIRILTSVLLKTLEREPCGVSR
ncbi:amidohydrolase [Pullulanibacillus pueri]|uniref:Amidohydrolase AmhX n=1 Tax=Pullulanibacillus pueri TaxID=1437324 RepID=A0A8J3EL79_9BACL|nr:M20 peptidase aminoacylase family protein [Pullulanibacillus pueri]MBM7680374.1 amidohydrolase [Pullulanibacillus pueri]GGH75384.1 amidohydrolase AmhX [Pullulanibacillus pueri]